MRGAERGIPNAGGADLACSIGAATFANRVFLASGPAGYGTEYADLIDLAAVGGVVTKTISLDPKPGNPGPRLRETSSGLLNSVGLENVGAERFFTEKLPALLDTGAKPVISLAAEDWERYTRLLEFVAARNGVDAVEINLSCPNVDRGGMAIGTDPELVSHYIRHAKDVLAGTAVIAKLTPNVGDIRGLAIAAAEAGADAITAINTVLGMDIDTARGAPVFRRVHAGLSGPAILPIALHMVWSIARIVEIPVIGVGGISSVADARKFFMAGASAVQVGTALFYDHGLPERIVRDLAQAGLPPVITE
jgi:dihydroorotate dehydrogenase (NAD+) catalytic subunit